MQTSYHFPLEYLMPGMITQEWVMTKYNTPLLKEGDILTQATIEKLKKRNDLEKLTIKIDANSVTEEQLDNISKNLIWDSTYLEPTVSLNLRKMIKNTLHWVKKDPDSHLGELQNCVDQLCHSITELPIYNLEEYYNIIDEEDHAIHTALFAICLTNAYNNEPENINNQIPLKKVATSALLHDFGNIYQESNKIHQLALRQLPQKFITEFKVPPNLLMKEYDSHYNPIYAYIALGFPIDSAVKDMILYSGELPNGKGPLQTTPESPASASDRLNRIAGMIINTSSLYDGILSMTINNKRKGKFHGVQLKFPEDFEKLLNSGIKKGIISQKGIDIFQKSIPRYPVGTRVQLNNGSFGIVTASYSDQDPTKQYPCVLTTEGFPFSLSQDLPIKIVKILPPEMKLSSSVTKEAMEILKEANYPYLLKKEVNIIKK